MENPSSSIVADLFATSSGNGGASRVSPAAPRTGTCNPRKAFSDALEAHPTVATLNKGVFAPTIQSMIQQGVSPITVNTYARAIKAFLKWLHEEGKCSPTGPKHRRSVESKYSLFLWPIQVCV